MKKYEKEAGDGLLLEKPHFQKKEYLEEEEENFYHLKVWDY